MTCYNCNYGEAKYMLNHMKLCEKCLVKRSLSKPEIPFSVIEKERYYLEGFGTFTKGDISESIISDLLVKSGFAEKL